MPSKISKEFGIGFTVAMYIDLVGKDKMQFSDETIQTAKGIYYALKVKRLGTKSITACAILYLATMHTGEYVSLSRWPATAHSIRTKARELQKFIDYSKVPKVRFIEP